MQYSAEREDSQEINWEQVVRSFGRQYEMKFRDALHWISTRSSLQVACEILGISLSPSMPIRYTSADLDILNSLGDFLWARGYQAPLLMEHHKLEYKWRERKHMGFSLSRDEYLKERALGKSKNRIAHQQGISGPALFHWLDKWGLKDVEVEKREIERLMKEAPPEENTGSDTSEMSGDTTVAAASEYATRNKLTLVPTESRVGTEYDSKIPSLNHASLSGTEQIRRNTDVAPSVHVQICMPLTTTALPENLHPSAMSRDQLMQAALILFQGALGQAHQTLSELLGATRAEGQIQQYVDNQIFKYFS